MKKAQIYIPLLVSYFFILLFYYASISKALDFENFQVQIGQSPLLSAYAGFISYAVIIIEISIVLLLMISKSRRPGLYASTALMSAFTIYIYLILNYSDFVPCSCGGILEKLGWKEHLIFNLITVLLGILALIILSKQHDNQFRRTVTVILSTNLAGISMVIFLFISSEHIIKYENNFTRRFLLHPVLEDQFKKLDHDQYYFAGSSGEKIYLGNTSFPQRLIAVDDDLKTITLMKIIPDQLHHPFKNIRVKVLYPYYFLYDGTVPVIYRGKLDQPHAETISLNDAYFSQMIPLDSARFALRTMDIKSRQLVIADLDLNRNPNIKIFNNILEKQTDGVFDSDGQLTGSEDPKKLVYGYAYRNQFLTFTPQFQIEQKLHTIDTVTKAKVQITTLSDGRHKMSAPPLKVNQKIAAYGNLALIQSDLKGKFESADEWQNSKIIDIYRTDRQEYIGSFHLYNRRKETLSDYIMTNRYLFAIIGSELVRYRYRKPLTDYINRGSRKPEPRVGTH